MTTPRTSAQGLPFDTCFIEGRRHSVDEFLRMPLRARVRYIPRGEVTFFRGDTPVQAAVALNGLRAAAADTKNGDR